VAEDGYELALADRDGHAAGRAVSLLRQAVDGFGPAFAEPEAKCLAELAGAQAIAGDADTAVTVGHQAIDAVTALHSPRAYDRTPRPEHRTRAPAHSAGVAEFRDRLSATAMKPSEGETT
jgi:hypothetical protein